MQTFRVELCVEVNSLEDVSTAELRAELKDQLEGFGGGHIEITEVDQIG